MGSSFDQTVYVQLLNEGTTVWRPTKATFLGKNKFKLLPTDDYDAGEEEWECLPGTIVEVEEKISSDGTLILVAIPVFMER